MKGPNGCYLGVGLGVNKTQGTRLWIPTTGKSFPNLQGEYLSLFLGKAAFDISVQVYVFFQHLIIKFRVSLSFALLSWAWQPTLVCYLDKPITFFWVWFSSFILKSFSLQNRERQYPHDQLWWIKVSRKPTYGPEEWGEAMPAQVANCHE